MPQWGKILQGIGAGGVAGAAAGAPIGGWGAIPGALIGGLLGGLGEGLSNRDKNANAQSSLDAQGFSQAPSQYSPEQQQAFSKSLQMALSRLENPTAGFDPIEQRARNQFATNTIPGLAERFTALGGSNTRGSSDLTGALGTASSDLEQGLASLRAQYGLQQQGLSQSLLGLGLTPQNEQIYFGAAPSLSGSLLNGLGSSLGGYLGQGGTLTDLFGSKPQQQFATQPIANQQAANPAIAQQVAVIKKLIQMRQQQGA